MFAPHTTHFTRTLPTAHPTTRRKLQVHDENNRNVLPSKTPSRTNLTGKAAVLANTGGPAARVGLGLGAKTEGRDRNVLGRTPAAGDGEGKGKGKGKAGAGEDIGMSFISRLQGYF